ncbi:hypothetical protein KI387_031865 [Taxus chinensis]|uniref:VWFA domain-containing protein n=1 Tax=Taxus chinensis TaxID=29808 RepID=A0AA38C155_TAXCH|nr:hypothetical protein KI387_031865 [Taxus chinensis]
MKYGPGVDITKDDLTHETYWQCVKFVDPYIEEEREEFCRCNHHCKSEEHETEVGGSDKSYCTENLWHPPIRSTGQNISSAGYITDDGHHFGYDHSKNVPHHVIFVIDRSSSMQSSDISPTMAKFNYHNSRLGCVYEANLRFIQARLQTVSDDSVSVVLFDTSANMAIEMEVMEEGVVDRILEHHPGGGTTYSAGLDETEKILMKGAQHHTVDVKKLVIVFLSDGGNNGGGDPLYYVDKMKRQEPRMTLHTIMFGRHPTMQILVEMAKRGGGTFEQTLDEIQLA